MSGLQARIVAAILIVLAVLVVLTNKSSHVARTYQVQAIFDDAAFAVPGEAVRIAGATVGSIQSLDVTPQRKAAVILQITDQRFAPFHADASCSIRPQSLIGEKYVDCLPGSAAAPVLTRVASGLGKGSAYLPVTRTHSPVDSDIVQSIYRQSTRQRFALIINELGTGLAARGADLNEVIHRADPALGYTDQVLKILAGQNQQLAQLARDSDTVLGPLAQTRQHLKGFIVGANATSVASASRAAAISAGLRLFPDFLRQLRPLLVRLGQLAGQGTPLMASLQQSATALGRQFQNLTPFARAARPALISLGRYSQLSQPQIVGTLPLARRLLRVGNEAAPASILLERLLSSVDQTGGIEQLMSLLYNATSAANGFDSMGHYVRTEPLVGGCTTYSIVPTSGCSAHFAKTGSTAAVSSVAYAAAAQVAARAQAPTGGAGLSAQTGNLTGLLHYLIGSGR